MPKNKPLVSIIMPVYNCKPYLELAINSIINQSYKNLEIIIVDDHSTDGSWEIIQRFAKKDKRICAFRNARNLKIVGTLNYAIEKSNGVYLARMDGDDVRDVTGIEKQVDFLVSNPKIAIVGTAVEFCDSSMKHLNNRTYACSDKEIRKKIFRYSPFAHGSIVIRKEMLGDERYELDWAEDYDLYFRLGRNGKMANLDEVLYSVRTHKASVSRSKTKYQEKLTLFIRLKAVFEYGYSMSASDKLYFTAQLVTMYLMPSSFRFWLFNKLRASE